MTLVGAVTHRPLPTPNAAVVRSVVQHGLVFPLLGAVAELRATGAELLPDGPVVLVANHESLIDSLTVLRALPASRRRVTAVAAAADYFFRNGVSARLTRCIADAVPVERGCGRGGEALSACAAHIARGGSVLLFPEGTRAVSAELGRFHSGAARLALATGVPVVPVGLHGTASILPKGSSVPRPGVIWLEFGEPIASRGDGDAARLTADLGATVAALRQRCRDRAHPAARS